MDPAEFFKGMDKDGDGKLSGTKFPSECGKVFQGSTLMVTDQFRLKKLKLGSSKVAIVAVPTAAVVVAQINSASTNFSY